VAQPPAQTSPLNRDRIVAAAIGIIESEGVSALSMRKLAAACDAAPMSLYRHVATKEDLLREVADYYMADVQLPDTETLAWDAAIKTLVLAIAAGFEAHPQLADIMSVAPLDAAAILDAMERITAALRMAGFDDEAVTSALAMLTSYATGHAHRRAERRSAPAAQARRLARLEQEPQRFATLLALGDRLASLDTDERFAEGLDIMLAVLRLARPSAD
jgi:AcrR family transcriptional regulator